MDERITGMKDKYKIGDLVRVKPLEMLRAEFGQRIKVPFGWVREMDKYAGGEYEIINAFSDGGYTLNGTGGWTFPECVFEDVDHEISFDKLEIPFENLL